MEKVLSEEALSQIVGGENVNPADYSEEELAQIFELYFKMYGEVDALPKLRAWGVTSGDYYLMMHQSYWDDTPYYSGPKDYRLAHLIYRRNHKNGS